MAYSVQYFIQLGAQFHILHHSCSAAPDVKLTVSKGSPEYFNFENALMCGDVSVAYTGEEHAQVTFAANFECSVPREI